MLTVLLLESVHVYVRGADSNGHPVVVKVMVLVQLVPVALTIATVHKESSLHCARHLTYGVYVCVCMCVLKSPRCTVRDI